MAEEKIKTEAAISEPQRLNLESRISNLEGKFEIFIGEMRDRDNQRAEDMREIRSKLDSIGNHVLAQFPFQLSASSFPSS